MKKTTIRFVRTLILVLGASALPLSVSKAQVIIFQDFTNGDTSGANIVGSTPVVGTVWDGNANGTLQYGNDNGTQTGNTSLYTNGSARFVFAGFAQTLGAGQTLTLTFNAQSLTFGGGGTDDGVSLFTGYTSANSGGNVNGGAAEVCFIGAPFGGDSWGVDGDNNLFTSANNPGPNKNATEALAGNTTVPTTATFTYVYNTGAWTLSTTGGVNMSGVGTADEAINGLEISNNNGGDIDLNTLTASVVPEPSSTALIAVGIGGLLLVMRRRRA